MFHVILTKAGEMHFEAVVKAEQLTKHFGDLVAVDHISFDVYRGECFGLLGPNGAGKTSTVRMINCTSPLTAGHLEVLGLDVEGEPRRIKSRLGVCPQEESLDPDLTVLQNLMVYSRYFSMPRKVALRRSEELLRFFSLDGRSRSVISELSGGMKRRLVLARAMINQPELLVLDEPTTGLDPQARQQIWERILQLKQSGTTILLTTHYMDEAARLCDRLVIMDYGKILVEGAPDKLVNEHIGRNVIEAIGDFAALEEYAKSTGLDYEMTPTRLLIYTSSGEAVYEAIRQKCPSQAACLMRMATLEDVFLRLTGRELRD
jgi:lipooligosaccharide transport system ATP-binding protein